MPIFKLLAVTGPILVGLLFLANATLAPRGPLFTNRSVGLSRSQPARPQVAEPTPEPPRPRAPRLVPDKSPQPAIAIPAWAEAPAPAPLRALVETKPAPVAAAPQITTEVAKTEPANAAPLPAVVEMKPTPAPVAAAATPQIKTAPGRTEAVKTEAANPEAAKPEVAKPEVAKTQVTKTAPAATAPTTKSAKVETTGTGAAKLDANKRAAKNSEASKREAVTTETRKAAPAQQARKPVVRNHDRDHRAASRREGARDHVPAVENGYAYGVRPGLERREPQRSWDAVSANSTGASDQARRVNWMDDGFRCAQPHPTNCWPAVR